MKKTFNNDLQYIYHTIKSITIRTPVFPFSVQLQLTTEMNIVMRNMFIYTYR